MDLLIISGFLGSGKTTVLLSVAKAVAASGRKIAIIENEAGKIGVDDQFLKEHGLEVKEIFSGCICCSLRIDLITTLLELERTCKPDVVILEPSGVAGPKQVIQSLYGYGGEIESKTVLSVVDALRFGVIKDYSMPLIADGIEIADAVIINKVDLVDSEKLCKLQGRIKELRSDVKIIPICGVNGDNIASVIELVIAKLHSRDTHESKSFIGNVELTPMPEAIVVALERELRVAESGIEDGMAQMVRTIVDGAKERGCPLIGHVKAIAKSKGGYLLASATTFDSPINIKGVFVSGAEELKLTVNAIVYGVEKSAMDDIVSRAVCDFETIIS